MANDVIHESGWERWHDWQARIMRPVTDWFCESIEASPGKRVLDAACGTGLPALAIAERVGPTGAVVATDASAVMVRATARRADAAGLANLQAREMDVTELAFAEASFDAVTCKDGLMYCDPARGAAELRRVLRPGGRLAVTAWGEPANNAFFTTLFETVGRFVPRPAPDPHAPGPFRLSRPGELAAVLHEAGVRDVAVERREVVFDFDSLEAHWQVACDMAAPVAAAASSLPAAELARFREALADALRPFTDAAGRVRLPNLALCASGVR